MLLIKPSKELGASLNSLTSSTIVKEMKVENNLYLLKELMKKLMPWKSLNN